MYSPVMFLANRPAFCGDIYIYRKYHEILSLTRFVALAHPAPIHIIYSSRHEGRLVTQQKAITLAISIGSALRFCAVCCRPRLTSSGSSPADIGVLTEPVA